MYCLPFHRLFVELGRVLGGLGLVGLGSRASGVSAAMDGMLGTNGDDTVVEASTYPSR